MSILKFLMAGAMVVSAQNALAQQVTPTTPPINCEDPANVSNQACLGLPDPNLPITNFAPVIAPVAGAVFLGALGGGGSTPSTPSTPSTN
tara:strand:- start:573 stop:842 length:270 start_codon:yes stop_codon:yes gene_type:complete